MMLNILYLLTRTIALGCSQATQLVDQFRNNNFTMDQVQDYEGLYYFTTGNLTLSELAIAVSDGSAFTFGDLSRMIGYTDPEAACPGAYLLDRINTFDQYLGMEATNNGIDMTFTGWIGSDGLEAVDRVIKENSREVKVTVKDNTLYLRNPNRENLHGIEYLLAYHRLSELLYHPSNKDVTALAGITAVKNWVGTTFAVAQSVLSSIAGGDGNNSKKISSSGGCYYKIENDQEWNNPDGNASVSNVVESLFNNDGNQKCPSVAECLYVRESFFGGSKDKYTTVVVGTDSNAVQSLNCKQYDLESTEFQSG